jgi:tetratricopeptide (TPR) repeat protein
MRFFTGESLISIVEEVVHIQDLANDYKHRYMEMFITPLLQACYNLMGRSDNPLVLNGDAMEEGQWAALFAESRDLLSNYAILFKMYVAIYMNELDHARLLLIPLRKSGYTGIVPYIHKIYVFLQGLMLAGSSQRSFVGSWRAQRCLKYLERASLQCPENHINKVFLLSAELAAAAGDYEKAGHLFDKAIGYAEKEGFLNEQALAFEKAARMYLLVGRSAESTAYFGKAINVYRQWGAEAKVKQLQELIEKKKLNGNLN